MAGQQVALKVFQQAAKKLFQQAKKKISEDIIWNVLGQIANGPIGDKIKEWLREKVNPNQPRTTVSDLDQRINKLDGRILDLARLVPELENQQKVMAEVIQTLSARIIIIAIVVGISFTLSLTILILVLYK